jgi:predicted phosphodiesterase
MSVFVTGDCHSKVCDRFSFKRHPELKKLTNNDYMFIAGDFGAVWDYKGKSKQDKYYLDFVASKPWTTIVVLGNHECWPLYLEMPIVKPEFVVDGYMRQCEYMGKIYDNIYIVDSIATLNIEDNYILCIAGADSHDREWRTEGINWWPQEAIDIDECLDFMEKHDKEHFDYIITHDAPAMITKWHTDHGYILESTCGERYFEILRKELDFDYWITGHFHINERWPQSAYDVYARKEYVNFDQRMFTIYEQIINLKEIEKL